MEEAANTSHALMTTAVETAVEAASTANHRAVASAVEGVKNLFRTELQAGLVEMKRQCVREGGDTGRLIQQRDGAQQQQQQQPLSTGHQEGRSNPEPPLLPYMDT